MTHQVVILIWLKSKHNMHLRISSIYLNLTLLMMSTQLGERPDPDVSPCALEYVAGTIASDDSDGISSIVMPVH